MHWSFYPTEHEKTSTMWHWRAQSASARYRDKSSTIREASCIMEYGVGSTNFGHEPPATLARNFQGKAGCDVERSNARGPQNPSGQVVRKVYSLSWRWIPRWRMATWLAVFIAAIILFASQAAGRRAGFTEYRYGWPFLYLVRDYRQNAKFASAAGFAPPLPEFF